MTHDAVIGDIVIELKLWVPVENLVDVCKSLEVVINSFDGYHRLIFLILGHGIVLEREAHYLDSLSGLNCLQSRGGGSKDFTLDDLDFQVGVKVGKIA